MRQALLNRAVALATGEALSTIRRRGFSILEPGGLDDCDDLPQPQVVNWDRLDASRPGFLPQRARLHRRFA
jgi:hypothetical protein